MLPHGHAYAAIQREFDGWNLWRSQADQPRLRRFWASRMGRNRRRPARAGVRWAMTVGDVATIGELREVLREQEDLASSG